MSAFIDQYRDRFGVEPICETLDVSASAYYQRASGERSDRVVEDEHLTGQIREVHLANYAAYGYRRVHAQLVCEDEIAGRDEAGVARRRCGRPCRHSAQSTAPPIDRPRAGAFGPATRRPIVLLTATELR